MEDFDPGRARRVEKPWGYEIWYALTDDYAGKILHVDRGHRLSLRYHERKDESCYVLAGRLLLIKGPSVSELIETTLELRPKLAQSPRRGPYDPGAREQRHPRGLHPSSR